MPYVDCLLFGALFSRMGADYYCLFVPHSAIIFGKTPFLGRTGPSPYILICRVYGIVFPQFVISR